ncbi:hypothetical protein IIA79_03580 [bacterium]|nr:hypothetical protein [bacterium]
MAMEPLNTLYYGDNLDILREYIADLRSIARNWVTRFTGGKSTCLLI